MTETNNLHLPQWEETDRIHHDDFNDAFAAIDAAMPRIAVGTYTGNASTDWFNIDLGFQPRVVLIVCITNHGPNFSNGAAFITAQYPAVYNNAVFGEITENGFRVTFDDDYRALLHLNMASPYGYIAIG